MQKTHLRLGVAAIILLVTMAAGRMTNSASAQTKGPGETAVKIDNFVFTPNTVTIAVGSTVHWTNKDDIPHNVVSEDKSFKSKVMDTDEQFSYTFTKPGTYTYFCSIHPKMTGKIIVQ